MKVDSSLLENKKSKNYVALILLGILIVVFFGLGIHYLTSLNNPRVLFTKYSNGFYEYLSSILDTEVINNDKTFVYDGNLKIETNIKDIDFLNYETIKYSVGSDFNNKKTELFLSLLEDNKEIIKTNLAVKNNAMYINLYDLFNKYIMIDDDYLKNNLGISINDLFEDLKIDYDIKYISSSFNNILNDILESVSYSKSNEILKLSDKEVNVNKISINLNEDNVRIIINVFADSLLEDDKLLTELSKIYKIEKDDLKLELNNFKKDAQKDLEITGVNEISLFTTEFLKKFIKFAIVIDGEEISYTNYEKTKTIIFDDIRFEMLNETFNVYDNNEFVLKGTINSLEQDNIDLFFESANETGTVGKLKYKKENNELSFELNLEVDTISFGPMIIGIKDKTQYLENGNMEDNIELSLKTESDNIIIKNNGKLTYDKLVANDDYTNNIHINSITDNDLNNILIKLFTNLQDTKLAELLGMLMES